MICKYCGDEVGSIACMSTRDMENRSSSKECFAALMILGGGERTENRVKAHAFRVLAAREEARGNLPTVSA